MVLRKARVLSLWIFLASLALLGAQRQAALLPPQSFDLDSAPFVEGEEVRYAVHWKPLFLFPAFKAGELRLSIVRQQTPERDAFQISAWANSEGLLKSVAGLDVRDYFESVVDARSFRSERFLYRRRQNEKKRDLEVLIDYAGDQVLIREVDVAADPPKLLRDKREPGVPPQVLDTLSVFYAARLQEMKPGDRFRLFLSNNGKIEPVDLEVRDRDRVKIGLGRFDTVEIRTRGGIFREGGGFRIWYTQDELRIPVKFEAEVKFGKVFGELIHLQTPRLIRGRVDVN